jgi:hypothetical protein
MTRQLYDAVVSPIWSDALLAMDYVSDPALRRAIMVRNWDAFLRGGQA